MAIKKTNCFEQIAGCPENSPVGTIPYVIKANDTVETIEACVADTFGIDIEILRANLWPNGFLNHILWLNEGNPCPQYVINPVPDTLTIPSSESIGRVICIPDPEQLQGGASEANNAPIQPNTPTTPNLEASPVAELRITLDLTPEGAEALFAPIATTVSRMSYFEDLPFLSDVEGDFDDYDLAFRARLLSNLYVLMLGGSLFPSPMSWDEFLQAFSSTTTDEISNLILEVIAVLQAEGLLDNSEQVLSNENGLTLYEQLVAMGYPAERFEGMSDQEIMDTILVEAQQLAFDYLVNLQIDRQLLIANELDDAPHPRELNQLNQLLGELRTKLELSDQLTHNGSPIWGIETGTALNSLWAIYNDLNNRISAWTVSTVYEQVVAEHEGDEPISWWEFLHSDSLSKTMRFALSFNDFFDVLFAIDDIANGRADFWTVLSLLPLLNYGVTRGLRSLDNWADDALAMRYGDNVIDDIAQQGDEVVDASRSGDEVADTAASGDNAIDDVAQHSDELLGPTRENIQARFQSGRYVSADVLAAENFFNTPRSWDEIFKHPYYHNLVNDPDLFRQMPRMDSWDTNNEIAIMMQRDGYSLTRAGFDAWLQKHYLYVEIDGKRWPVEITGFFPDNTSNAPLQRVWFGNDNLEGFDPEKAKTVLSELGEEPFNLVGLTASHNHPPGSIPRFSGGYDISALIKNRLRSLGLVTPELTSSISLGIDSRANITWTGVDPLFSDKVLREDVEVIANELSFEIREMITDLYNSNFGEPWNLDQYKKIQPGQQIQVFNIGLEWRDEFQELTEARIGRVSGTKYILPIRVVVSVVLSGFSPM